MADLIIAPIYNIWGVPEYCQEVILCVYVAV